MTLLNPYMLFITISASEQVKVKSFVITVLTCAGVEPKMFDIIYSHINITIETELY